MPHYAPGKYRGKIIGQRFGETKNGTHYFAIRFQPVSCVSDEHAFPTDTYDREVTLFLSDKALPYSIAKLRHLGWNGVKFTDLEPSTPGFFDLKDAEITVACTISETGYEDWNLPGGGSEAKESTPGIASLLDRTYGKELLATVQAPDKLPLQGGHYPEPTITPEQAKAEANSSGDEIPF